MASFHHRPVAQETEKRKNTSLRTPRRLLWRLLSQSQPCRPTTSSPRGRGHQQRARLSLRDLQRHGDRGRSSLVSATTSSDGLVVCPAAVRRNAEASWQSYLYSIAPRALRFGSLRKDNLVQLRMYRYAYHTNVSLTIWQTSSLTAGMQVSFFFQECKLCYKGKSLCRFYLALFMTKNSNSPANTRSRTLEYKRNVGKQAQYTSMDLEEKIKGK
jgi:hypothetical protein